VSEDVKKILVLLVAGTCLVSFRAIQSDKPIVRYRLIGQSEAFQEDGGVRYSDFVADTGTPSIQDNQFVLQFPQTDNAIRVRFQRDGNQVGFTLQGVQTEGTLNSWTRLKKRDSSTFGPDIECDIWFGTTEPKDE
jgi:hypothetical protein